MTDCPRSSFLIILIAPSGGGKSTVLRQVMQRRREDAIPIVYSISYTTRKPRGAEQDGLDYFFLDREEFDRLLEEKRFLEHAEVHGNMYGTSRDYITGQLLQGRHVILDIDVQGALSVMRSGLPMVTIFMIPPDLATLEDRLTKRGTDSAETIALRLENARMELEHRNHFDYLVVNDDLEDAILEVESIIRAEECRISRYRNIEDKFYGGTDRESES